MREENEEKPPTDFGNPEHLHAGTHKVVFGDIAHPCDSTLDEDIKPVNHPEFITIVQDECNPWEKNEKNTRGVRNRLLTASVICILFIAVEAVGGYISNSLVIAADAAQLLTVFSTLMASILALKLSDRRHPQAGSRRWYRAEVMAALVSILITWVLTSIVLYLAYDRLVKGRFIIDVDMMLATSAFGVVANLVMGMILHNNCHVRYPECKFDPATVVNINVRAAFIHIVCDFLFSLAVFITALFIDCCPDWHIVDPISTFVFSLCVLFITLAILKDILDVLTEETPRGFYFDDVLKTFLKVEGVQQVQDLRLWALSLDKIALSAHLTIRPGVDFNEVLKVASRRIHARYNFYEMTLHVEIFQENVINNDQVRSQIQEKVL